MSSLFQRVFYNFSFSFFFIFFFILLNASYVEGALGEGALKKEKRANILSNELKKKESLKTGSIDFKKPERSKTENKESYYQDPTKEKRKNPSYLYLLFRLFFVLFVLIGIIFLLYFLFRYRFLKTNLNQEEGLFRVVKNYFMGPNKQLAVVKIVNSFYLFAMSQDNMSLIEKVEDKEMVDAFKLEASKKETKGKFFTDIFSRYGVMGRGSPIDMTKRIRKGLWKT